MSLPTLGGPKDDESDDDPMLAGKVRVNLDMELIDREGMNDDQLLLTDLYEAGSMSKAEYDKLMAKSKSNSKEERERKQKELDMQRQKKLQEAAARQKALEEQVANMKSSVARQAPSVARAGDPAVAGERLPVAASAQDKGPDPVKEKSSDSGESGEEEESVEWVPRKMQTKAGIANPRRSPPLASTRRPPPVEKSAPPAAVEKSAPVEVPKVVATTTAKETAKPLRKPPATIPKLAPVASTPSAGKVLPPSPSATKWNEKAASPIARVDPPDQTNQKTQVEATNEAAIELAKRKRDAEEEEERQRLEHEKKLLAEEEARAAELRREEEEQRAIAAETRARAEAAALKEAEAILKSHDKSMSEADDARREFFESCKSPVSEGNDTLFSIGSDLSLDDLPDDVIVKVLAAIRKHAGVSAAFRMASTSHKFRRLSGSPEIWSLADFSSVSSHLTDSAVDLLLRRNFIPECTTSLDLTGCKRLTPVAIEAIGRFSDDHMQFRSIVLRECAGTLTREGAKLLAPKCRTLRDLDLSCLSGSSTTDMVLVELSRPSICTLERVNLAGCWKITDLAMRTIAQDNLCHLNLDFCERLTDNTLHILSRHSPDLVSLSLRYCDQIGDAGIIALSRTSGMSLRELHLDGIKVTDAGINSLACHFGRKLRVFSVANCTKIGDYSLQSLMEARMRPVALDISNTQVTSRGLALFLASGCALDLEELALSLCPLVERIGFAAIGRYCKRVTSLDVSKCDQLDNDSLTAMLKPPRKEDCVLTEEELSEIKHRCQVMKLNRTDRTKILLYEKAKKRMHLSKCLKSLDISDCPSVSDEGVLNIFMYCGALEELTARRLDHVSLSAVSASSGLAAKYHHEVRHRSTVGGYRAISDEGAVDLVTRAQNDRELRKLFVPILEDTLAFPLRLKKVDLSECTSLDESEITQLLRRCPNIHTITMKGAVVKGSMEDYLEALGGTSITDVVLPSFSSLQSCAPPVLLSMFSRSTNLKRFSISRSPSMTDMVVGEMCKSCPSLQRLSLFSCKEISDRGLQAVGQHLRHLREINLTGCEQITDNGLLTLAHGCPHLRTVEVGYCPDVGYAGISALLDGCDCLESLVVAGTKCGDDVARRICESSCKIVVLDMSSCPRLTDNALVALSGYCHSLEVLNVSECDGVSDEGVWTVVDNIRTLRDLGVSGCSRVSNKRVHDALMERRKRIRFASSLASKLSIVETAYC